MKNSTFHCQSDRRIVISDPGKYLVNLDKTGIEVKVVVNCLVKNKRDEQYSIIIHHQAPHTKATTTMKSVVGKGGSVKLVGKIVIDQGAYGCSSFLTQRILLLDPSARGEAVPELEILNNDVQCSHAASISSIPDEQLHYLQSRGLSKQKATRMIAEGFLSE